MSAKLKLLTFSHQGETLAGFHCLAGSGGAPGMLFLHGGGSSESSRTAYLAERLAGRGISSFSLDFSGHGQSSGLITGSSLEKRRNQARAAFQFLDKGSPKILCGSSMGGYIALKLLADCPYLEKLVLFCPAVYDGAAFGLPFGPAFTECIRRPESWRNTDVLAGLEAFRGDLRLYIGEEDQVIPEAVVELIDRHSGNARSKVIRRYAGCPHQIHFWLSVQDRLTDEIADEIAGKRG